MVKDFAFLRCFSALIVSNANNCSLHEAANHWAVTKPGGKLFSYVMRTKNRYQLEQRLLNASCAASFGSMPSHQLRPLPIFIFGDVTVISKSA